MGGRGGGGRAARALGPCVAAAVGLAWAAPALASGDYGCAPRLTLIHRGLDQCNNLAILSPGNDTRTNLLLLRPGRWRSGTPGPLIGQASMTPVPGFSWSDLARWTTGLAPDIGTVRFPAEDGSRCRSDGSGAAAFVAALASDPRVGAEDRVWLSAARTSLRPTCDGDAPAAVGRAVQGTGRAGEFATYLTGAAAFYAGAFDQAAAAFAKLGQSANPWLAETATYMLGRVEVNRAQVGLYDRWGWRDPERPVDRGVLDAAEAGLRRYLAAYPTGRYAGSARGLFRRVYWLGGDTARLSAALADALQAAPAGDTELLEEIDDKLLANAAHTAVADPRLLAALDLGAMRRAQSDGSDDATATSLSRAQLEGQRDRFGGDTELFDLLRANHAFYVGLRPAEVLTLIPDATRPTSFSDRQFSRQVLRGLALDATDDRNARGFWLEMLPGAAAGLQRLTLELALALHEERHDGLGRVFAPGSPIANATLRDTLLAYVAGPDLLRHEARGGGREGRVALHALLHKELTRGRYAGFLSDLALLPAGATGADGIAQFIGEGEPPLDLYRSGATAEDFACPALTATASTLARDPGAVTARLCLGEFIRLNDLDGHLLDTPPPADELGGTAPRFGRRLFSRGDAYAAIVAAGGASPDDIAYALLRATRCYAPSGYNTCGGTEVDKDQRRRWFERLHREFAGSRWASESRYYW